MVTGIETAGLVLALFPLIISILEQYKEGFETIQEWWNFRTEFLHFIRAIGRQSILFSENLEELLAPMVTSDAEMDALLTTPLGDRWRDPELEERLKDRLPKSYELYLHTIDEVLEVMEKIKARLGIKRGQNTLIVREGVLHGRMRWDYEFRRFKFTFSRRRREKLSYKLAKLNGEMQDLLGSSDKLAPSRRRRSTTFSLHFQRMRDQAGSLHAVLTSGWRCACRSYHNAYLLLKDHVSKAHKSKSNEISDVPFNLLLYFGKRSPDSPTTPWTWHKTEVRISEVDPSHPIAAPAALEQAEQEIKERIDLLTSVSPNIPRASRALSVTSSKGLPFRLSKKVGFAADVKQQSSTDTLSASPSPSYSDVVEILNLCTAIQQAREGQASLGFLRDKQRRYEFYPITERIKPADTRETISLEDLLKQPHEPSSTQRLKLSRRDRIHVAVILSASLLQLYSTPWLGQKWTKKDILFLKAEEGSTPPVDFNQLYIAPNAVSEPTTPAKGTDNARALDSSTSIFALGVMLLELCFGEALEDQIIRRQYLGPDGEPNDFTDFATARHWQNEALGEGGPEFANAIRRCVLCAFGPKSTDLADDEFREAVYNEVVQPLDEMLRHIDQT